MRERLRIGNLIEHVGRIEDAIVATDVLHDVAIGNEANHHLVVVHDRNAARFIVDHDLRNLANGCGARNEVRLGVHRTRDRDLVGILTRAELLHGHRRNVRIALALVAHEEHDDDERDSCQNSRCHERQMVTLIELHGGISIRRDGRTER